MLKAAALGLQRTRKLTLALERVDAFDKGRYMFLEKALFAK